VSPARWSTDPLERWAAVAMLGAGAAHGLLVRSHLEQWWGYGVFFVVASLLQILLALALLTDAVNPRDTGPRWRAVKTWLYGLGIAGNAALVALYVVTRTTGIPAFGPEAGEVEAVQAIDILTKALELAAIALLALLLRRARRELAAAKGSESGRGVAISALGFRPK
jgi:hypothetical protein